MITLLNMIIRVKSHRNPFDLVKSSSSRCIHLPTYFVAAGCKILSFARAMAECAHHVKVVKGPNLAQPMTVCQLSDIVSP
jgi:hypothetical protein